MGGNTALALLLVIATNVAGIFTMPFVLAAVLRGGGSGVALAPLPLLRQLLQSILAPLLVGVSARALVPGARCNVLLRCCRMHFQRPEAESMMRTAARRHSLIAYYPISNKSHISYTKTTCNSNAKILSIT